MTYVKVTAKRQVTFPRAILEKVGINKGDLLEVSLHNNVIGLKAARKTLLDLRGSVKVKVPQDLRAVRERVAEEVAKEAALEGKNN